jgi:hypothetical protein
LETRLWSIEYQGDDGRTEYYFFAGARQLYEKENPAPKGRPFFH